MYMKNNVHVLDTCRYNVHVHYSEDGKRNVDGSINAQGFSTLKWYNVSSK